MSRQRRHFAPEQKVALLREHLLDKVPISDLCEKHGITVNNFYHRQQHRKHVTLSELMEEQVRLKKRVANSERTLGSP